MFGLSFLNSIFLWGLAAASIPIIIHLIKRNRAIKLPFAAMRFLNVEPNKKVKVQNLKQFLLLLMRVTALAFLALAFARPLLENRQTAAFWGDEPKAAVILIDNSFSMGVGNKLTAAKEKAAGLLKVFRPRDQATMVQFGETSRIIARTELDFMKLVNFSQSKIQLSNEATDYMQALQTAESILMESQLNEKHIYVISDFQMNGWLSLNPHWTIRPGIIVDFIQVGKNNLSNVAVLDLHINRRELSRKYGDFLIKVKNYSPKIHSTRVVLTVNGKKKSQRNVRIGAGEETVLQFRRVSLPRGYLKGAVELLAANDEIELDNRYYFVLQNQSKSKVLAINGEPKPDPASDELFFLERAINLPKVAKYSLVETRSSGLNKHDLQNFRAVILANVKNLNRRQVERLTYYVRGGGGLLIALGDLVKPNIFNSLFQALSPARLNNRAFKFAQRDNSVILAAIDYQHPIFKPFAEPGQGDPSAAQFYQYFHVAPDNPESVLASFDDDSPAILEKKVGAGKVLLLTSSIDSEWNNLPVKAMYLPLLYRMLDYVSAESKGQKSFLVGQPVALSSYRHLAAGKNSLVIKTPSGHRLPQESDYFESTTEPGIYEVYPGKRKRPGAWFAVNVNPDESDLAVVSQEDLQVRIADVTKDKTHQASLFTGKFTTQQEKSQKLWRLVILLVILLLVSETWLANRTYR